MAYEECTVVGRNAVMEAYRSGKTIDKLFILDGCQDGPIKSILREARKRDTLIKFCLQRKIRLFIFSRKASGCCCNRSRLRICNRKKIYSKKQKKKEKLHSSFSAMKSKTHIT